MFTVGKDNQHKQSSQLLANFPTADELPIAIPRGPQRFKGWYSRLRALVRLKDLAQVSNWDVKDTLISSEI